MNKKLIIGILLLAFLPSGCRQESHIDRTMTESEVIGTVSVPEGQTKGDDGWIVAKSQTYGHSVKLPCRFAEYTTPLASGCEVHGFTCKLNTGYELNVVRSKDQKSRSEEAFFAQFNDKGCDLRGPFDFKGHRAVHITDKSTTRFGQIRFVYVNGIVYMLMAEGPKGRDLNFEKTISRFFDSLEITD